MRLTVSFLLFALGLFSSNAVVSNALFVPAISTTSSRESSFSGRSCSIGQRSSSGCKGMFLQKDNNGENDDDEKQTEKPTTMTKGTRPSMNPILFNIDAAITFGAIIFVLVGYILQVFGYSYVVEDGHLRIDTLEYRQFHDEVVKAAKEAKNLSNLH